MRNLKKVLSLVLCLAVMLSVMVVGAGATKLSDYSDSDKVTEKYAVAVDFATQLDILKGVSPDRYAPQGTLTRAQLATMIYRIATGDVEDVYVKNFAAGAAASFTDTPADSWYAGYVGYCADAGYLKGVGNDQYRPNSYLTGYQALAAVLRAIGYNEPGQFTGADWTVQVAMIAKEAGMLEDIDGVDLNSAISREVAAQILFNALFADTVKYTPAFGYQPTKVDLATKVFNIVTDKDGKVANDDWGRPATEWYDKAKDAQVSIAAAPLATYNVAVSECDIAKDVDLDKDTQYTLWDNGIDSKYTVNPTDTKTKLGAQGTLVEVYEDDIVVIDTYLAKVKKVTEEETDKNGHVTKEAKTTLKVWDLANYNNAVETADYAEDAYVLVNYNEAEKELSILKEAPSFDGAQTKIWTNAKQHTIDGTTYDDAAHYNLDQAGNKTEKFTWFQDQYGNVIGSVAIDRISYEVLKDIIWKIGTPGYAEATLVDMQGNERTVTVNEFDGISADAENWVPDYNDAEPNLNDSNATFPHVSSDTKYNDLYLGYALYEVTNNDDGTVDLDGAPAIGFDADANIDVDSSRILDVADGPIYVDADTEFLVREGNEDDGYTYGSYDRSNVPEFARNAVIYYTVDDNNIATRVYVKDGVLEAELGDDLFVTTDNCYKIAGTNDYYMTVNIDGVERTVAATKTAVEKLAANEGKLFHVTWNENPYANRYGFVKDVRLVNEFEDNSASCDYLTGDVTIGNKTIISEGKSYTITNDTVFVGAENVTQETLKENGVWVAYSFNDKFDVADVIYVGEKLNKSVALTVTAKDGSVAVDPDDATKITVTSVKDATADELTYTAKDENSVVIAPSKTDLKSVTETVYANNNNRTVTVWNEAGTKSETYNIALVWDKAPTTGTVTYQVNFYDENGVTVQHTLKSEKTTIAPGTYTYVNNVDGATTPVYDATGLLNAVGANATSWTVMNCTPKIDVVAGGDYTIVLDVKPV